MPILTRTLAGESITLFGSDHVGVEAPRIDLD